MFYLLIIIWIYENFIESVDYTQYGNTLNFVQIVIKPLEYLILEFIHSIYLFFVTWVISYEVLFLLCGTNSFIEFKYFTEHNKFQCKIIMFFLPIHKFSCPFYNTYCFTYKRFSMNIIKILLFQHAQSREINKCALGSVHFQLIQLSPRSLTNFINISRLIITLRNASLTYYKGFTCYYFQYTSQQSFTPMMVYYSSNKCMFLCALNVPGRGILYAFVKI